MFLIIKINITYFHHFLFITIHLRIFKSRDFSLHCFQVELIIQCLTSLLK
jgi:hypothetical protein